MAGSMVVRHSYSTKLLWLSYQASDSNVSLVESNKMTNTCNRALIRHCKGDRFRDLGRVRGAELRRSAVPAARRHRWLADGLVTSGGSGRLRHISDGTGKLREEGRLKNVKPLIQKITSMFR